MAIKNVWVVVTKYFLLKGRAAFLFAAFTSAISLTANASVITLEPDDYGVGVALENEYVTTALVDGPLKNHAWNNTLVARDGRDHDLNYEAPTGNLIFGAFSFIYNGDPEVDLGGLGIKFHQDVSNIKLLANSIYPPGDLAAVWMAFDIDGNKIASGYAGGDRPANETFEIEIQGQGVRSLVLGGDFATSAICFDHLTFELKDVVVSESGSIVLFFMGLMILALRLKQRL
jgi:hypothetical protein